jgi:hypothetical protein
MDVHRHAPMLGEQRGEFARRSPGDRGLAAERALAVRSDVGDRPALEQTVRAVGVDGGGGAAMRLGRRAEHRNA